MRIVERLGSLEQKLNQRSGMPAQSSTGMFGDQLRSLDEKMLDIVCKEFTFRVLKKLINSLKETITQKTLIDYLNEVDVHGSALIHYLAHENYTDAIQILLNEGVDANIINSQRENSLTIAASKGHELTV